MPLRTRFKAGEEEVATVSFKSIHGLSGRQAARKPERFLSQLYGKPRLRGEQDESNDVKKRSEEYPNEASTHEKDENNAEHADGVVEAERIVGQHVAHNVTAIERGQREQVEDREHEVEK